MRKLLFVLVILNSIVLHAQIELKGKRISDRLDMVNSLLADKQYELAISRFDAEDTIILKQNVKKYDLQKYISVLDQINLVKSKFGASDSLLTIWETLDNEKEYEKLLFSFKELDEAYISKNRISFYKELKSFISQWDEMYFNLKDKYIFSANNILEIEYSNYEEAVELVKQINDFLTIYNDLSYVDSKSRNLLQNIKIIQNELISRKKDLDNYIQSNKPISLSQLNSLLISKKITIEQIKRYFSEIDYQFSKYYVTINLNGELQRLESYEFINLLNLDVVGYYKLHDKYDTELKQKLFKQTVEYKQLLQKLKTTQNQIVNSYLYMSIYWGASFGNYNLKTKTFSFRNTKADGYHFGYNSGYLQFDDICVKKPNNIPLIETRQRAGYDTFLEQIYHIPVIDEKLALFIEENSKTISLMFVLKFEGIETKKNEIFETDYLKTVVKNIIVFDRESEKIIINYSY